VRASIHPSIHPSINLQGTSAMNNIVYIIGAVVIILAVLSFVGLR
jgi:hypothetical protein